MRARINADRWVIYSTFDPEGWPDEPAVEQLVAYRSAGFKTLVIDTSPVISEARQEQWDRVATRWRKRDNVGYDFGSYKFGLELLVDEECVDTGRLDLVITNDSCFGPSASMAELFQYFDEGPDEPNVVCGITDSIQGGAYHIQSYWIYFRAAACHHATSFFGAMKPATGREEAIRFGEISLGEYLRSTGCRLWVRCPWSQTIEELALTRGRLASTGEFIVRRVLKRWKYNRDADMRCLRWLLHLPTRMEVFNPAVLFGVQLYRTGRSPFIKKSMFRENVYHSPEIPPGLKTRGMTNSDVRQLLEGSRS